MLQLQTSSVFKIGLPSRPNITENSAITTDLDAMSVLLRVDALGVLSNNATVVFEIQAISSNNASEITARNFTITNYTVSTNVSFTMEGLKGGNYTIRSRVFNKYGPSEYSELKNGVLIIGSKCI